jgi:hypothetical protein
MQRFVLIRERGSGWDHSRPMREQELWDEHADFMEALVDEGFIVLGGLLGEDGRAMHVVDAGGEEEIHARLADDPWTPLDLLRTASIERWEILLGG